MTLKKIYIVRHGQTAYNLKGIVQGRSINADLNQTGRDQAESFFQAYKDQRFDRVITSSLKRTHQSVQKFLDHNANWEIEAGFDEISWGKFDGEKITEDHEYWEVLKKWNAGQTDFRIEDGESPEDVKIRQQEAWKRCVLEGGSETETILLCMHGRALRVLLATLSGKSLQHMDDYKHANLGLYIVETNGTKNKISGMFEEHLTIKK